MKHNVTLLKYRTFKYITGPADGEASWSLLPSSVSLLSSRTVQPENTYSRIRKATGQVWESQKKISITLITATTSVHLPKPVSTDLKIKPDSVLTKLVDVKHLPHKAFLL